MVWNNRELLEFRWLYCTCICWLWGEKKICSNNFPYFLLQDMKFPKQISLQCTVLPGNITRELHLELYSTELHLELFAKWFSLTRPSGPGQSYSRNVCMYVCMLYVCMMYVPCEEDLSYPWRGLLHPPFGFLDYRWKDFIVIAFVDCLEKRN